MENEVSKKVCNACLKEKELSEFYKDSKKLDGLFTKCKYCIDKKVKIPRPKIECNICKEFKSKGLFRGIKNESNICRNCAKTRIEENHKECTVCKEIKHKDLFPINNKGKYGVGGKCKQCVLNIKNDLQRDIYPLYSVCNIERRTERSNIMIVKDDISTQSFSNLYVIEPIFRKASFRLYYRCLCDCGEETTVEGSKIKNGHTKSCGCIKKAIDYGAHSRLESGESAFNSLFGSYSHGAKTRGLPFELTKDEAKILFKQNCFYCGVPPSKYFCKTGMNGAYLFNGIDRKDNSKDIGYILSNCVTCCTICNYRKSNTDVEDFIEWVKRVYTNLKELEDSIKEGEYYEQGHPKIYRLDEK